eukprot:XP_011415466.1 PREDICTED: uncharacterized protein LOC105319567 [Crassostrea gigas]
MLFSAVFLISTVSLAVGMTTTAQHGHHHSHHTHLHGHHSKPTHEPSISESFVFHFDAMTHTLAVRTNRHCYLYMLTADQQTSVHTSTGLHAIEKSIIDMIDTNSPTVAVTAQDLTTMSAKLSHFCRQLPALKLN